MRTPGLPDSPIGLPATTTIDPCPIPPNTAMLFVANDVAIVDGQYGMTAPLQSCATATGRNEWFNGMTQNNPQLPMPAAGAAGNFDRTNCANPCICDAAGGCYKPENPADPTDFQQPILTFYPHCDTTCYIAVIMQGDGQLTPVAPTAGPPFLSENQLDPDTFDPKDVNDPSYMRAKSVSCGGCPIVPA
uniref:Uncharacterized protein n=1 Tax=Panagrolaimus sp. PS1159 TaxID=55785 RepID=A0AC35EUE6_9BILA